MEVFKIDEEKEVLQHSKDGVDFKDLGVSRSEYTLLMQEVEKLKKLNKETLPIYKSYNLTYSLTGNEKLKELIDEAGLELPATATAFEIFTTRLPEIIKEKLGEYKSKTGKHFPFMRNFVPLKFKVNEAYISGYVNSDGVDYQGLSGVTYPFSKDVEVTIGKMPSIPIISNAEMFSLPLVGVSSSSPYYYKKTYGTLTEGGNPDHVQKSNSTEEYYMQYFTNPVTTLEYPNVTLKTISIDGSMSGDWNIRERGVNATATIIHGGRVLTGQNVDTSVLVTAEYLNRYEPNPQQNLVYERDPVLSIITTPKLEKYDYTDSTYKPMMIAAVIPTNDINTAADHISKMHVGGTSMDYNEMNFLTKVLGSADEMQKVSEIRSRWNVPPMDISGDIPTPDITFNGDGETYPTLYVISDVALDEQEIKLKVDGFFPIGQAKAKYKFETFSTDMYTVEPSSQGEHTEDITVEYNPIPPLEHVEVKSVYGAGPTLHLYKVNMTYPEHEFTTHRVFKGVVDLKLGPNALS